MDDRTRMFFEEFGPRGLGILTFSFMIAGAPLSGAEGQILFQAQLLMSFCLIGSIVLLVVQIHREGGFSLSSYSSLGPSPLKFVTFFLLGSSLAAFILNAFSPAVWILTFFVFLGLSCAWIILWWYMERGD